MRVAMYKGTRPGLHGLYSRLTRWIDGGIYSHCELIFSDGVSASASYIDGGVRFKDIYYDSDHWDFIEVPAFLELGARIWCRMHVNDKYDLWGNVRFAFGFARESKNKWFCSEAVMAALGYQDAYRFGPNGMAALLSRLYVQGRIK